MSEHEPNEYTYDAFPAEVEPQQYAYEDEPGEKNDENERDEEPGRRAVTETFGGFASDWKLTYSSAGEHRIAGNELLDASGNSLTEVVGASDQNMSDEKVSEHHAMVEFLREHPGERYVLPEWREKTPDGYTLHITVATADANGSVGYETWSHVERVGEEDAPAPATAPRTRERAGAESLMEEAARTEEGSERRMYMHARETAHATEAQGSEAGTEAERESGTDTARDAEEEETEARGMEHILHSLGIPAGRPYAAANDNAPADAPEGRAAAPRAASGESATHRGITMHLAD